MSLKVAAFILTIKKKKKLDNLNVNNFCWTPQRAEVPGQITTSKSGETGISREIWLEICFPGRRAVGDTNWSEHFDLIFTNCWRLNWTRVRMRTPMGPVSLEPRTFSSFPSKDFSLEKDLQKIVTYTKNLLHHRSLFSRKTSMVTAQFWNFIPVGKR